MNRAFVYPFRSPRRAPPSRFLTRSSYSSLSPPLSLSLALSLSLLLSSLFASLITPLPSRRSLFVYSRKNRRTVRSPHCLAIERGCNASMILASITLPRLQAVWKPFGGLRDLAIKASKERRVVQRASCSFLFGIVARIVASMHRRIRDRPRSLRSLSSNKISAAVRRSSRAIALRSRFISVFEPRTQMFDEGTSAERIIRTEKQTYHTRSSRVTDTRPVIGSG